MRDFEHYRKTGYEDHGYVSPELSSDDTYPDYIKDAVGKCIERIKSHETSETFNIAFMTDIHYTLSLNHEIRFKRTMNAYKEIAKKINIDKLILGGDFTNEGCKEHKTKCFEKLRTEIGDIQYFPVNGNHDDGTIWDIYYINSPKSVNHLTHKDLYNLFYDHLPFCKAEFEQDDTLYYLVDDRERKIRYIFLDTGDIPYNVDENGKLKHEGQHDFAFSQKQTDWLINHALYFEENGWNIILSAHTACLPSHNGEMFIGHERRYLTHLNDILSAYKQSERLNKTYYSDDFEITVDADFSMPEHKAEILFFLLGDYHSDIIETNSVNILYIATANAVMYYAGGNGKIPRYDGDKSEILFDILTVNKSTGVINITRVGAGEDRTVKIK